ncbi:MAG: amidohydrolase family protein [Actinomycetota bacterium]
MATYFANVSLFDGRRVKPRAGVLVSNGHISWVGSHARAPRDARAAEEIEGKAHTLSPGLIDCHVHLCFDGSPDFSGEARRLTEARAAIKAVRNAALHLQSGVTTVRDLGGLGTSMCDVAQAIEEGVADGTRVRPAGQALTVTGGHGHGLFALEVDGADALRTAVRRQVSAGAKAIKLIATGGVLTKGIRVDVTAYTLEELEAAVDEAHKWDLPVAAHAHGAAGIDNAVRAGVDSIEHGSQISARTAKEMKERGTFHVPTISALAEIVSHGDEVEPHVIEKGRQIADQARDAFHRAHRAGVRVACGTDAGTPFNPHGTTPHEIVRMAEWGLPPLRALEAATANAAELLRVEEIGTVEEGKVADLVLWSGDPIEEIDCVLKPALVMQAGEILGR